MKKQIKNVLKYQYLLGKVSTFLPVTDLSSKVKRYQYLLGKVSTLYEEFVAENDKGFMYQYLLGKVSTQKLS